ncbi:MAG: hypothetical protein JWN46_3747, partial [Acidimicrobiales bacterium]|nr:hypothetical protein [Acidimicrobiales bacterium]
MRRTGSAPSPARAPFERRTSRRSRVPLHRRLLYQRAAIGHWLVVAALVVLTTSVVHRLLQQAAAAQARWGATRPVL